MSDHFEPVRHITARNVNEALCEGLTWLTVAGEEESSRNGPVLVSPSPAMTTYLNPRERVLFSPLRDANPFFHLMESLWMLGGRNDLAFPLQFNSRFGDYSDDGITLHGAYGFRWREHFGVDQLMRLAEELRTPGTRRAVLGMWDPAVDLGRAGADLPCNTHAYFSVRTDGGGHPTLDMTVLCRSNDAIWGAYGANAVHFSMLQEVLAELVGARVGRYTQYSHNFHVYLEKFPREQLHLLAGDAARNDLYGSPVLEMCPTPLIGHDAKLWLMELDVFLSDAAGDTLYEEPFFNEVAAPVYNAWLARRRGDLDGCLSALACCQAPDWRYACEAWVTRRLPK